MTDDDRWRAEAREFGWTLPPPAAWPLRLWGIRHLRFAWLTFRVERWAAMWGRVGVGLGWPNPYDRWLLYAVLRGWI